MATTKAPLRTDSTPLEEPETPPALPKSYAEAAQEEGMESGRDRARDVSVANGMIGSIQMSGSAPGLIVAGTDSSVEGRKSNADDDKSQRETEGLANGHTTNVQSTPVFIAGC